MERLRLSPRAASNKLGLHIRSFRRYLSGEVEIPSPVAQLFHCWLTHKCDTRQEP